MANPEKLGRSKQNRPTGTRINNQILSGLERMKQNFNGDAAIGVRRVIPELADGEDNRGLFRFDREGRKWHQVDHISNGRIIYYGNNHRGRVVPYEVEDKERRERAKLLGKF